MVVWVDIRESWAGDKGSRPLESLKVERCMRVVEDDRAQIIGQGKILLRAAPWDCVVLEQNLVERLLGSKLEVLTDPVGAHPFLALRTNRIPSDHNASAEKAMLQDIADRKEQVRRPRLACWRAGIVLDQPFEQIRMLRR